MHVLIYLFLSCYFFREIIPKNFKLPEAYNELSSSCKIEMATQNKALWIGLSRRSKGCNRVRHITEKY